MVSGHESQQGEAAEIMPQLCPDLLHDGGFVTPTMALWSVMCFPSIDRCLVEMSRGGASWESDPWP